MKHDKLKDILMLHELWISGLPEGKKANLRGADLIGADLRGANLRGADLIGADLRFADLSDADLISADLRGVDLRFANLIGADLRFVDLRLANLSDADLSDVNLSDAKNIETFTITPIGGFTAFKKTTKGVIKVYVPARAKRVNKLGSRKIRVSELKVIDGKGCGGTGTNYPDLVYEMGQTYTVDNFNDDVREECAPGLHIFLTEYEAEQWQ